jgi:hypothetical protein
MVSSFIEEELIDFIIEECKYINVDIVIRNEIEKIVSSNTIGENQEIIMHYVGDVYDAIKLYNNTFNPMNFNHYKHKETFYTDLAYISLYTFLNATITDLTVEEDEDS